MFKVPYSITIFDCTTLTATLPTVTEPASSELEFGTNFSQELSWGNFVYTGHEDYCTPTLERIKLTFPD